MNAIGEAEMAFQEAEHFISNSSFAEEARDAPSRPNSSNILVGKGENGSCQYFLYLLDPMEKGQTLELHFHPSQGSLISNEARIPIGRRRQQIEDMICRLSSNGLRTLLNFISKLVYEKIDKRLGLLTKEDMTPTEMDKQLMWDSSELKNLAISRRRVHWIVSTIKTRLKVIEDKGSSSKAAGFVSREYIDCHKDLLWSLKVATKLRAHPAWDESIAKALKDEVLDELEPEMESSDFLNSSGRKKWCPLAERLFNDLVDCFTSFSTLLDGVNSQEKAVNNLRDLLFAFVEKLSSLDGGVMDDIDEFALSFNGDDVFDDKGSLPRAKDVIQKALSRAYFDALALSGDPSFDVSPLPGKIRVVATEALPKVDGHPEDKSLKDVPSFVAFRTPKEAERTKAVVHKNWYINQQMLRLFEALTSCSKGIFDVGVPFESLARTALQETLRKHAYDGHYSRPESSTRTQSISLAFPCKLGLSEYRPHSFQLFLGLVWPMLRSWGWRLETGDLPSDTSFVPPGQISRGRKGDKRTRMMKQELKRTRIKLAKAANDLGLGFVPKLTKRLFVRAVELQVNDGDSSASISAKVTVNEALRRFLEKIENEITTENEDSRNRARVVVGQIKSSFDELAPMLLSKDYNKEIFQNHGEKKPSEYVGCEYLARLVLVLPSILCQAGLSMRLIDDTKIVLKELAHFLALDHSDLFDELFHPEQEVYTGDKSVKPVVASRLETLRPISNSVDDCVELDEAVLPEDRPDLTDFVEIVMSQVIPCRATQEDLGRKNRRIGLGSAGLVCRHCLGANGEGKYFFGSVESITTASTVIEKHIQKCPRIADDIKQRMAASRKRHAEQRKGLAPGAQAAYFLRLWERLRSSKVKDTAATLQVLEMKEEKEDSSHENALDEDESPNEFTDHIRLLEYLSTTSPWSETDDVLESLNQYYECLEFGGRIYNTDAMPKGFNAEWLLAQVTDSAHTTMG